MLLEAVQSRESLWNTKAECYKNRNMKKYEYAELIQILKEEIHGIDLPALKGRPKFLCPLRVVRGNVGSAMCLKSILSD